MRLAPERPGSSWSRCVRGASSGIRPRRDRCAARPGARARTSAPGTRPRSPTSPGRARRLELRLLRALGDGARRRRRRARGARAARRAGERLGVPRPPRQAGDYPYQRATGHAAAHARGHTLTPAGRNPRLRNLAPDLSLTPLLEPLNTRPHPLLGVPAADRGRAGPPRAQALREPRPTRDRGPRPHPRRRGVARRGDRRRGPHPPRPRADAARRTWASSSPGSSG